MVPRIRIGSVWIDAFGFSAALDAVERLMDEGNGGAVFTPNVDHVVNNERSAQLREAYAEQVEGLIEGGAAFLHAVPHQDCGSRTRWVNHHA